MQHQFGNTPEQNIATLCSRFHLYEVELHCQRLIKPHATAVWDIFEGFSELKWAWEAHTGANLNILKDC